MANTPSKTDQEQYTKDICPKCDRSDDIIDLVNPKDPDNFENQLRWCPCGCIWCVTVSMPDGVILMQSIWLPNWYNENDTQTYNQCDHDAMRQDGLMICPHCDAQIAVTKSNNHWYDGHDLSNVI